MTTRLSALPLSLLTLAAFSSGGCAQRQEESATGNLPTSAIHTDLPASATRTDLPTLVAIQEIALPPLTHMDIHSGSIAIGSKAGCAQNPPIYVIAGEGISENIVEGDYVLKGMANSKGAAIVAALVDPNTFGATVTDATDALVVLDTMTLQAGSWRSENSEAGRLFSLTQRNGSIRLTSKSVEFSVCRFAGKQPSEAAVQVVTEKSGRRNIWVTQLDLDAESIEALKVLNDPRASASARQQAFGTVTSIQRVGGSGIAVATAPSKVPSDWTAMYTARGGAWDYCARPPADQQNVQCSAGANLNLVGLVPSGLRIFGPDTERYVRLRLKSNPTEASIFSGAVKQPSQTNTVMDILAEELPRLRLEKAGFQPCPYGPRWTIRTLGTGRRAIDATCTLVPVARDRKRR